MHVGLTMKKITVLLLILLYVGTSSGAVVRFHYCMGQLVKLGIGLSDKGGCTLCSSPKKTCEKSCCKDDYKLVKTDKSQKVYPNNFQFEQVAVVLYPKQTSFAVHVAIPVETGKASLSNAPPSVEDTHLFIRNCAYRI